MGFSETLESLFRAIYADPDRDEPRLAYAQHVGTVDPARGELVRLQVERYRADVMAGRWRSEPGRRERELLRSRGADWAQLLVPYSRAPNHDPNEPGYEYNRGFPELLLTQAATFVELGEDLLRLGPVQHLHLFPDETPLSKVLAMPALRHLVTLTMEGWKLGDDGAAAIAACANLTRLASLGLRFNGIGAKGVEALAASPRTRGLVMIDLRANPGKFGTIAIDELDESGRNFVRTELGEQLEGKYGHIPWLHPAETLGADRYHIAEVMRRRRAA